VLGLCADCIAGVRDREGKGSGLAASDESRVYLLMTPERSLQPPHGRGNP